MNNFHYKSGVLCADGLPLTQIAQNFSTPSFVYSEACLTESYKRLSQALNNAWPHNDKPLIAYASKANSNLDIMSRFARMGAGCDIVSQGELRRALKAGFDPKKILFSGVGKTKDELSLAIEIGIHQINVETKDELILMSEICTNLQKKIHVALRFNPDIESHAHSKTSTGEGQHKFGLMDSVIFELFDHYNNHPFINIHGLSMHIGSGVPSLEPFQQAFLRMAQMIKDLRARGHSVHEVDLGGGIWVPYQDEPYADLNVYAKMIADIFGGLDVKISVEPGRILVAESGCLLTRVISVKEQYKKRFIIVDAGMNELIRPTLYDSYHPILSVQESNPTGLADIVGPVCETGDYFALDRNFPDVKVGDLIAIMITGAYGTAMSSHYNSRPLCAEIIVTNNNAFEIRKRQSYDDLWANEIIRDQ